ncbi:hypothetical protein L228DRAFT_279339 [Xylona heveae TC161]|uniref:OPA3-domain-containing protein n=1 Tax=Xylona heveae (strain CBS 132557 / TC161) TaxID=1328760 RepID=A0A165JDJ2_XYLHT|nr:hypothetical protein L228DRAFT_279339 [Xylona heveae TC161]KZF26096.1 hypothetical protein L228DRAFT_279339 [Xylona heveae TC161]
MSSITLKLTSLIVKTLSKPIANQIKAQAREHERFRRVCVSFAQSLHQLDMRLRLGLLRDTAAIERQAAKEAAAAQAKKHKHEIPTVKTEAQTKADETAAAKSKTKGQTEEKPKPAPAPRIRPLSEAKAIDSGANFISETFLFLVGGGLILFESFRSRRKENTRREDVADKINELQESEKAARRGLLLLEREVMRLRAEQGILVHPRPKRILPEDIRDVEPEIEPQAEEPAPSWVPSIFKSPFTSSPPEPTPKPQKTVGQQPSQEASVQPEQTSPAKATPQSQEPTEK